MNDEEVITTRTNTIAKMGRGIRPTSTLLSTKTTEADYALGQPDFKSNVAVPTHCYQTPLNRPTAL